MNKQTLALLALLLALSANTFAAAPKCYSSHGGYCQYRGKVSQIYINRYNLILLYFDTAIAASEPAKAGFSINNRSAAAYAVKENPEFAKLFYSTALAAQASGRDVIIQMRGNQSGYLKFDRIWLYAPK